MLNQVFVQNHHQLQMSLCYRTEFRGFEQNLDSFYTFHATDRDGLKAMFINVTSLWLSGTLYWRHNEHDCVPNHQHYNGLLNRLFRHRSEKTSKLRFTGLCEGNSRVPGEFLAQRASNAENGSISRRHHESVIALDYCMVTSVCPRHIRYIVFLRWAISDIHCVCN